MVEVTKIPSVNAMYLSRRNGGRYLNPDYAAIKDSIKAQLVKAKIPNYSSVEGHEDYIYYLNIVLAFKFRFNTRDASNCIKLVEDAIQDVTKVNDTENYRVSVEKLIFDDIAEDKLERIYINLTPVKKNDVVHLHSEWNKTEEWL